jgi:hypothetical protein
LRAERCAAREKERARRCAQKVWRKIKKSAADNMIAAGSVSTQAMTILRIVPRCRPERFAGDARGQHVGASR